MSDFAKIFKSEEGAEIIDVSPDIARILIETSNRNNRRIKPNVVKKYAKIMKNGDWKFSPETISVSKTGRLLNGQHRMLAVIESGVTCRFLFARGFDDEVFSVLDRGAVRTRADALKMDKKLAECAALLCRLGAAGKANLITDADVSRAAFFIEDAHASLIDVCNTSSKVFSTAPFRLAAVVRVISGDEKDYVFGLYRNLVLSHTEVLPPIGHATVRAVLTGRLFSGSGHTLPTNCCVAWDVFNIKSSQKSKISVSYKEHVAAEIVERSGYARA